MSSFFDSIQYKNRFILTTAVFLCLYTLCGAALVGVWSAAVDRGAPDEATNYDITFATVYIFLYSINYLVYERWVLSKGSPTLNLLIAPGDRTFCFIWLNRFCTAPAWIIVSTYYIVSVLGAESHQVATSQYRSPFLSGALIACIDLMLELRAANPSFMLHHAVAVTATLLACEFGHFDIAVSMYSLQAAHDKTVWLVFFFSRLKVSRDRSYAKCSGALVVEKANHQPPREECETELHQIDDDDAQYVVPTSSSTQREDSSKQEGSSILTTQTDGCNSVNSAPSSMVVMTGSHHVVVITTVTARDCGHNEPVEPSTPSSQPSSQNMEDQTDALAFLVPGLSLDDPTNVTQVHQHLAYRIQMESEERGDEHWVDNLFPSYLSLSYWYCAIFVYYSFVVRLGLNGCLIAYLVKYWDDVALLWKIVHPISGLAFAVMDLRVYQTLWSRSYWGGGHKGENSQSKF